VGKKPLLHKSDNVSHIFVKVLQLSSTIKVVLRYKIPSM